MLFRPEELIRLHVSGQLLAHSRKGRSAIARWFPDGTRVTRPEGGVVLWVELPPEVDGLKFHQQALRKGIAVAPGTLFTTSDRYRNCIRVSGAFWSDRTRDAIRTLGGIASSMARGGA
jgi:DNA-binding transcriptional MocR family regulator